MLEYFGKQCAMAASAATLARDLIAKADFPIGRKNDSALSGDMTNTNSLQDLDLNSSSLEQDGLQQDSTFATIESDELTGLMDFAFSNSIEWLSGETSNISDTWTFTHDRSLDGMYVQFLCQVSDIVRRK
ncbi:hypothetical protein BDZ45DRAFT_690966 [Acephala macrosclerotiorum]|nr:hypothetical protein BDZ45DRAFT_690966 [Acephala macrosclerotiorum]